MPQISRQTTVAQMFTRTRRIRAAAVLPALVAIVGRVGSRGVRVRTIGTVGTAGATAGRSRVRGTCVGSRWTTRSTSALEQNLGIKSRAVQPADSGSQHRAGAEQLGADLHVHAHEQLAEQSVDERALRRRHEDHRLAVRDAARHESVAADRRELHVTWDSSRASSTQHLQQLRPADSLRARAQRLAAAPAQLQDRSACASRWKSASETAQGADFQLRVHHRRRRRATCGTRIGTSRTRSRTLARRSSRSTWPSACWPTTRSACRSARWRPSTSSKRSPRSRATTKP